MEALRSEAWRRIDQCRRQCARVVTATAAAAGFAQAPADGNQETTPAAAQGTLVADQPETCIQQCLDQQVQHERPQSFLYHRQKHQEQQQRQQSEELDMHELHERGRRQVMRSQQQEQQELEPRVQEDALLITLLDAEARAAARSDPARQGLQPHLSVLAQSPLPAFSAEPAAAQPIDSPSGVTTVGVSGNSAATGGIRAAGASEARGTPESALAGQSPPAGPPAIATAQLQWIREALILLRRIDDPCHVQLQRRKRTPVAAVAPAAAAPVVSPAGGMAPPEETTDLAAATCWPESQTNGPGQLPRSSRTLHVLWIGAGGGPWGGRSDTWLQQRKCAYTSRHVAGSTADAPRSLRSMACRQERPNSKRRTRLVRLRLQEVARGRSCSMCCCDCTYDGALRGAGAVPSGCRSTYCSGTLSYRDVLRRPIRQVVLVHCPAATDAICAVVKALEGACSVA